MPQIKLHTLLLLALAATTTACEPCKVTGGCKEKLDPLTVTMQQAPSVRTPANVTIFFRVLGSDMRGVAGLTTADFNLYEDDALVSKFEAVPLILPKPGRFSSHTMLLLDLSGSILSSGNLTAVKNAATNFVKTVVPAQRDGTTQVGISWFDGAAEIHLLVPYTNDQATLLNGISGVTSNMSNDNSTNLYGAVIAGVSSVRQRVLADRATGIFSAGSLLIFTDGSDQAGRATESSALSAINTAKSEVASYTIGLGGEIKEASLKALGPSGYESAKDLNQLVEVFTKVGKAISDDANSFYILEYCSPKRQGAHTLDIEVKSGNRVGKARGNFQATNFTGGCKVTG